MVEVLQRNLQNYGDYYKLVTEGSVTVYTNVINKDNLNSHFICVLNILRDGIEDDFIHFVKVNVIFADNQSVTLSIFY